jgi:hypothetical protein
MSKKRKVDDEDDQHDELVPDPQVWREFGVTPMTGWRWDQNAANPESELAQLGWPPPIQIRSRNFRSRRALERFKKNAMRAAIQKRARRLA